MRADGRIVWISIFDFYENQSTMDAEVYLWISSDSLFNICPAGQDGGCSMGPVSIGKTLHPFL